MPIRSRVSSAISSDFWRRAPRRARPRRRRNSTALAMLLPTVVDCTHVVSPSMFGWGAKRLSRFSAVSKTFLRRFYRFWTRFSRFRGLENLLKATHVTSDGVREAHGMYLCQPGPWAGRGGAGAWV